MNRVLRLWTYFRRAHGTYTSMILSMINYVTVTYTLLLVGILGVPKSLTYFVLYALIFVAIYGAVAIAIGRWDYRKGSARIETELASRANPYTKDLSQALQYIANAIAYIAQNRREEALEEIEKARKILSKWIDGR